MAEKNYKTAEELLYSITLPNGNKITFDMMKITMSEWKAVLKPGTPEEEEHKIIAKVTGLAVKDLEAMLQPVYRMVAQGFLEAGTQPLTNPT